MHERSDREDNFCASVAKNGTARELPQALSWSADHRRLFTEGRLHTDKVWESPATPLVSVKSLDVVEPSTKLAESLTLAIPYDAPQLLALHTLCTMKIVSMNRHLKLCCDAATTRVVVCISCPLIIGHSITITVDPQLCIYAGPVHL